MKRILFALLLLTPSAAFAGMTFDISCENVDRISITRNNDSRLIFKPGSGPFHAVYFRLKPEAARKFAHLLKASRTFFLPADGTGYESEKLTITTHGKALRNDAPAVDAHGQEKVGTIIFNEQDAFDLAREVCPTLTPDKELVARQGMGSEGAPLPPATALAQPTYDLSCENVKKVLIVRMPNGWLDIHALKAFFIPSPSAHGLRGKNNYSIS